MSFVRPPRAVLFDRDGTLVVDVPYCADPALVTPVSTAPAALALLRAAGIPAYVDSYAPTATRATALLQGQFLSVDEGDRTQRVWIGFGLGGSKLQIKMQVLQGGLMVAEGEVQTTSNLKPGMVASLGVGAATGAIGMAAAIGGGTAVANEALLVSVEKDAKQAAKAVSERIIQGYKDRGWLSR